MNNYNEDIFQFSNDSEENSKVEQTTDFNYNSISGLGESNYENEDLFQTENTQFDSNLESDTDKYIDVNNEAIYSIDNEIETNSGSNLVNNIFDSEVEQIQPQFDYSYNQENNNVNNFSNNNDMLDTYLNNNYENYTVNTNDISNTQSGFENYEISEVVEEPVVKTELPEEVSISLEEPEVDSKPNIEISDTSIEELNKLTEYKQDEIESTNINELFDKVSVNVKDASDIFRKNTEMKQKIDSRFEELKKLQSEVENSKKAQIEEINKYKEDVLNKLTDKKEEIEKRLNTLKELQASLEKDKKEFEDHKRKEQENIDRIQKEVQSAYDDRREELNHIEDALRKQKDVLDEERSQLSLDKIQYESDKNELANNLLKFNELVNSFTNGVEGIEQ